MYPLTGKKVQSNLAEEFLVRLGNNQIKGEQPVKFLGVIIDENWIITSKTYWNKLAFASNVIYKARNILPVNTFKLLYFCIHTLKWLHCSLGSATTSHQKPIHVKQNNILRSMTFSNYDTQVSSIYKRLRFLKVQDIYILELAKLMHRFHDGYCPVFAIVSSGYHPIYITIIQNMLAIKPILFLVSIVILEKS